MKKWCLIFAMLWCITPGLRADEGMWLLPYLSKLNIKDMKAKGLKLSAEDIYSINKAVIKDAIVMFGSGCTGEVVSDRGLVLTNHHCGYGAIQQHSTVENDYLKNGFWAMSDKEEIPTPGLTVTFIRRIEDVSDRVLAKISDTLSEDQRNTMILQSMNEIINEVKFDKKNLQCEIKDFLKGNQYLLIVKEIYRDVRLVGTPPSSIGKFGGDTDNWMWPRHTGDFSLFRIYADAEGNPVEYSSQNVPYAAPVHLPISLKGYKPGDFTMVIGFPGSTQRYSTSYEVDHKMKVANPNRIFIRGERQKIMMEDMISSDENRIKYSSKYNISSNYWKNAIGENRGLKKLHVLDRKKEQEKEFEEWIAQDPQNRKTFAEALPLIRESMTKMAPYLNQIQYFDEALLYGTELIGVTRKVFLLGIDTNNNDLDSSKLRSLNEVLARFYKDYNPDTDRRIAKKMFAILRDSLPEDQLPSCFVTIRENFDGNIDHYIDYIYDNSMFTSQERWKQFTEHPDINVLLNDPAYKMQRGVTEALVKAVLSMGQSMESLQRGQRLYQAGLMKKNPQQKFYPDANLTIRFSYGQVLPYQPQDGVFYDFYTTLKGVMEKENPENALEFSVPDRLKELYRTKDYGIYGIKAVMPVNFITSNDITGGNSGSPVLNGRGELIGLAFDGNWEAMSGNIVFEPLLQRTIAVDIRYVLFIIDRFAGDTRLIDEMTLIH